MAQERFLVVKLAIASLLLTTLGACGELFTDRLHEECGFPETLIDEISKSHPTGRPVVLTDLDAYDQEMFSKDHGARCPGAVEVDFYGSGDPTWAVVVLEGTGASRRAFLIVARQSGRAWIITRLRETDAAVAPVVWSEGPGSYENMSGSKVLEAEHPVIVFVGYESWALVFAWSVDHVDKVRVSD